MPESPTPLHLIPDAPITSPGFDRLDRMGFVRSFTEGIRAVEGVDSVVLALAGPWGSGKSSLLNLIAGQLRQLDAAHEPLLVRFNPWWFTGSGRLVAAFLQQLGAAVSRPEVRDQFEGASLALDRLSEALAAPGMLDTAADPASRDIEMLRRQLNETFAKADRRVLIFMDDIDRLTPDEMTQLLLIVRAVADFPNTTYILALDHTVVSEAISDKLGVDGRTYLEKVILLQIDVPMPGRMMLERLVVGQLEAIDAAAKSLDEAARRHFRMLFEGGVKHFLATPRACTRLLNVIRFTYPTLAGQVYFADMLGIACLMSFASQAVQAIRSYSDAFVGHCDPSGRGWIQMREFHNDWLSEIPKSDRSAVEAIVRAMFPKVAWALNGPLRGEEYLEVWERNKRICSPQHFDSYFRLGLTADEAAEHRWQNMVELLDDATAFSRALQRFGPLDESGSSWVGQLLERVSDYVQQQASSEQAGNLFRAIMRRGDEIAAVDDESGGETLNIDQIHRVVSVLITCLRRVESPRQRRKLLRDSVSEDSGLLTTAEFLDVLEYRSDLFADGGTPPTAEEATAKLVEILKLLDVRIREAARNGQLAAHPSAMKIAQKWWHFGRRTLAQKWVRAYCEQDRPFVEALLQLASTVNVRADQFPAGGLPLEFLTDVFGRAGLVERCQTIREAKPEWLTPDGEQLLAHLAQSGKPPEYDVELELETDEIPKAEIPSAEIPKAGPASPEPPTVRDDSGRWRGKPRG